MCWGCMHPSFPDPPASAFFSQVELTPTLLGLTVDNVGEAALAVTAGVLTVHAARRAIDRKKNETAGGDKKDAQAAGQTQEAEK